MVVPFQKEHLASVAELERICFSSPWSEKSLAMLLSPPGYGFVYLEGDTVAAYCGMLIIADELQIMNLATHPDFRRRGCAKSLLDAMYTLALKNGVSVLTLDVRNSNTAARKLYISEGFAEIGVRPGYYFNPPEAAIIMEKKL